MKKSKVIILVFVVSFWANSAASAQSRFYAGAKCSAGWSVFGGGGNDVSAISSKGISLDIRIFDFFFSETGFVLKSLTTDNQKALYRYASVPVIFKLKTNFVNLSAGASVAAMTEVAGEKPTPQIGGASMGIIAKISKDWNISDRWIFEPSFGLEAIFPTGGGLTLGLKLKYNL